MAKVRVSTTVDDELLRRARAAHGAQTDASLLEAALEALLREHRSAEIDAEYAAAYERHPVGEPDAWGDLSTFLDAARRT